MEFWNDKWSPHDLPLFSYVERQVPMHEVNRSVANYVDVVGNWRLHDEYDIKNWLPHHVTEVISTLMPPCPLIKCR